jgi:hypothetical protein
MWGKLKEVSKLCAVAHGPVHDHVGTAVFDADGGRLCCAGFARTAWGHLHGNETFAMASWGDGFFIEPRLPATLVGEPAREALELYALLGCPLGFGQAAGAPLRYVLELFTYARIVLGFHANPAGGLEDLNIDSIYPRNRSCLR